MTIDEADKLMADNMREDIRRRFREHLDSLNVGEQDMAQAKFVGKLLTLDEIRKKWPEIGQDDWDCLINLVTKAIHRELFDAGVFPPVKVEVPKTKGLTFGEALEAMKTGKKVGRKRHDRKFIWYWKNELIREGNSIIVNVDNHSYAATDWEIVEEEEKDEEVGHRAWLQEKLGRIFLSQQNRDMIYDLVLGQLNGNVNRDFARFLTEDRTIKQDRLEWLKNLILMVCPETNGGIITDFEGVISFNELWKAANGKPFNQIVGEEEVHDIGWAVRQMREGKKVRCKSWSNDRYWFKVVDEDRIKDTYNSFGASDAKNFVRVYLFATDWEVYEEPVKKTWQVTTSLEVVEKKTKGLTFSEALEEMKAGNRIRRPQWAKQAYYVLTDNHLVFRTESKGYETSVVPTHETLATDWEIAE